MPADNLAMWLDQSRHRAYGSWVDTQSLIYDSCKILETLRAEECDLFFAVERRVDLLFQLGEYLRVGAE